MRKFFVILSVLCVAALSTFAQSAAETAKFSIGVDLGAPTGTASDVYSFAIGGSVKYEIPAATALMVTLSAGYESFMVKSELKALGLPSSSGFVPVKAGLKYYFNNNFFGEAQVGVAVSTASGGGSAFAYAPGVGYTLDGGFEVGLRYEGWAKDGTLSQFALRAAFRFQ